MVTIDVLKSDCMRFAGIERKIESFDKMAVHNPANPHANIGMDLTEGVELGF